LHDSLEVKIGLAVTDQVNFFGGQFSPNLAAKISEISQASSLLFSMVSFLSLPLTLEKLNSLSANTLAANLGIEFTEIGQDYLTAKMPVDHRTHQPFGLLHGGASVALAETLGSVAAYCCVDQKTQCCVGLDINANHIKAVKTGFVYGTTRPIHVGKKTQVWEVKITTEEKELVCISRITMAVIDRR
jgi:1,4-dihydroxy-2-naphthoyl-CoA hydrolase